MIRLVLVALLLAPLFVCGQQPERILKRMLHQFDGTRNIRFQSHYCQQYPCDGDTVNEYNLTTIYFTPGRKVNFCDIVRKNKAGKEKGRWVCSQENWYTLHTAGMNYEVEPHSPNVQDGGFIKLLPLLSNIENSLHKAAARIQRINDTLINNVSYFQLLITDLDSMIDNRHNYIYTNVVVDKKMYLPVFYKKEAAGFGTKNGKPTGWVTFFESQRFFDYRINKLPRKPAPFIIPAGFEPKIPATTSK